MAPAKTATTFCSTGCTTSIKVIRLACARPVDAIREFEMPHQQLRRWPLVAIPARKWNVVLSRERIAFTARSLSFTAWRPGRTQLLRAAGRSNQNTFATNSAVNRRRDQARPHLLVPDYEGTRSRRHHSNNKCADRAGTLGAIFPQSLFGIRLIRYRQPFSGGVIPDLRIHPIGKAIRKRLSFA